MFRLYFSLYCIYNLYTFSETILESPIIFDSKISFWKLRSENSLLEQRNQADSIHKFFDYIDAAKNTHRIIKDEFSKNNQTYYACKGDLFFIRTDVLRKGLSGDINVGDFLDVKNRSPTSTLPTALLIIIKMSPTYGSRQIYTRNTFDFQNQFSRILDFLSKFREGHPTKFNLFHHQKFYLIKSLF